MVPYVPPAFELAAFNCPHCNAYANQSWYRTGYHVGAYQNNEDLKIAFCAHCKKYSLWHFERMIYPEEAGMPPNDDLGEEIKSDYQEARAIVAKSPRGAAAILRLAIQKLCRQLGEKGENINEDIGNLVKKGLSVKIQQSLDIVRVIGNNAVHPGQIDMKDDRETALTLFSLVNLVAETMITQPKEIERIYGSLPEPAKVAINKRDTA